MTTESRARGYLLTEASLNLFENKKSELDLSLEDIAGKTGMSVDSVKRLLNGTAVQQNTVHEIAKVLEIDLADIQLVASRDVARTKVPSEPANVLIQKMLSDIEADGNLEAEDVVQRATRGSSVEQKLATNLKTKDIKFGSLTQEA